MDVEQSQVNLMVVRASGQLGVDYYLGGSLASSIHGTYHATADADFMAALPPEHAQPFVHLVQSAFYADLGAITYATKARRSFNIIHLDTMLKVDVFVAQSDPFAKVRLLRRVIQTTGPDSSPSFYVSSPEDTVLAKLQGYRDGGGVSDRQRNDVLGVLKVQAPTIDRTYMKHWAGEPGITELLPRAFDDAGLPWNQQT